MNTIDGCDTRIQKRVYGLLFVYCIIGWIHAMQDFNYINSGELNVGNNGDHTRGTKKVILCRLTWSDFADLSLLSLRLHNFLVFISKLSFSRNILFSLTWCRTKPPKFSRA